MINEFTVEAVDLGDLEKLRIGHDNSGVEKVHQEKFTADPQLGGADMIC